MWGLIKVMAPFGPLDYKEYTIIQTPKGPIILINPHVDCCPSEVLQTSGGLFGPWGFPSSGLSRTS